MIEKLDAWLGEISRWCSVKDFIQESSGHSSPGGETKRAVRFFTHTNKYHICATWTDGEKNYLGCCVSSRKPRAGESWARGNDLADGRFCRGTWERIKNDIIAYELVKVAKPKKAKRLEEYADNASVLPMKISETGARDEPLCEAIICDSISGGARYKNDMPEQLSLVRRLECGGEFRATYQQVAV